MPSPWEVAPGDAVAGLRPELRTYFATIPADAEGAGEGVFAVFGTPRRGLRPLLRLVGGPSIWPVRATGVPFEVRNRAAPGPGVVAERRVHLGDRVLLMRDLTVATAPGTVVDRIGSPPRIGTFAIRTETELVLKSRWVVPDRLLAAGFAFRHTDLEETLRAILRRPERAGRGAG